MGFSSIKINNVVYTKENFTSLLDTELCQKQAVVTFLSDWYNKKSYIEVFTSGSTGKPKKIKLKKSAMLKSAQNTCEYFSLNETCNALLCLPVEYIAGKMMLVRAFYSGYNLLIDEPRSNPFKTLSEAIDFTAVTPFQLQRSLKDIRKKKIKKIIVGGAAVSSTLQKSVRNLTSKVFETYGMTETCSHIALRQINGDKKPDAFTVLNGVNVELDKRTCLVINAPGISKDPIITNDIAELLESDKFRWLGRFDNVINSAGIKISPEKVEKKIIDLIKENFYITGKIDPVLGQKVVIVIEGEPRNAEWEQNLLNDISSKVNRFELPKEIIYMTTFEKTKNGKILRVPVKS